MWLEGQVIQFQVFKRPCNIGCIRFPWCLKGRARRERDSFLILKTLAMVEKALQEWNRLREKTLENCRALIDVHYYKVSVVSPLSTPGALQLPAKWRWWDFYVVCLEFYLQLAQECQERNDDFADRAKGLGMWMRPGYREPTRGMLQRSPTRRMLHDVIILVQFFSFFQNKIINKH